MTKAELMKQYEEVKKRATSICLFIHMPTGETEIITNPNVAEKIAYIDKTYDDNLVHSNCKDIYIEDIYFAEEGDTYNFGAAIDFLKDGLRVARKGWNGKGMWICLIPHGNNSWKGYPMQHCIGMKTADGNMQPGWVASQADMLAEDWVIVE